MSKLAKKHGTQIANLALAAGTVSAVNGCRFILHQPKVPAKLKQIADNRR